MNPRIDPAEIGGDAARVDLGAVFAGGFRRAQSIEQRLIQIGARGRIMRVLVVRLRRGRATWRQ